MLFDAIRDGDEEFLKLVLTALSKRYGQALDILAEYNRKKSTAELETPTEEGRNIDKDKQNDKEFRCA